MSTNMSGTSTFSSTYRLNKGNKIDTHITLIDDLKVLTESESESDANDFVPRTPQPSRKKSATTRLKTSPSKVRRTCKSQNTLPSPSKSPRTTTPPKRNVKEPVSRNIFQITKKHVEVQTEGRKKTVTNESSLNISTSGVSINDEIILTGARRLLNVASQTDNTASQLSSASKTIEKQLSCRQQNTAEKQLTNEARKSSNSNLSKNNENVTQQSSTSKTNEKQLPSRKQNTAEKQLTNEAGKSNNTNRNLPKNNENVQSSSANTVEKEQESPKFIVSSKKSASTKKIIILKHSPKDVTKNNNSKQLQITEFYKQTNNKTSPIQKKSNPESPEKNSTKTNRYTEESHNRVIENVRKIANSIHRNEHFSILFTKSENDFLNKLLNESDLRIIVLCLRLYTRQSRWFNLFNFCTELNIESKGHNLHQILDKLKPDYVSTDYSSEKIIYLLKYLTAPEIKDICNTFKISSTAKKDGLISKLLDYVNKQSTLTILKNSEQILRDRVYQKMGLCVKLQPKVRDIIDRIHLLYSLTNPSLESPNDIYKLFFDIQSENIKYPKFKIDSTQIFADRNDFLKYAESRILLKEFDELIVKKDISRQYYLADIAHQRLITLLADNQQLKIDQNKKLFLRRFSASWIYCKVLSTASQNLGKHYSDDVCKWLKNLLKQEIYCCYKRGLWYTQLAMVLQAHKKDIQNATRYIIDGITDKNVSEVSKYELTLRGSKIKKTKISTTIFDKLQLILLPIHDAPKSRTIQSKAVYSKQRGKLIFETSSSEGKEYGSVEETAIKHYKNALHFTDGIHCEGRLLNFLFIIFFWDILFQMNIPHTFISEIQNLPLDLFSRDFYPNRKNKIDARLNDIQNVWNLDQICTFFSAIYSKFKLEINSVAKFGNLDDDKCRIIIRCIGKKVLAKIFHRLAEDYVQFSAGFPDLFLWNSRELKCYFVEVKSMRDILSTKQILWINYLDKIGANVEVCHVSDVGSKSKKKAVEFDDDNEEM